MRKTIVATATLMLSGTIMGTMVPTANAADITFSGDARARFNYQSNYQDVAKLTPKNEDQSFWNSRVRLQFQIKTKGGAYAVGRFRLEDGTWDGGTSGHPDSGTGSPAIAGYPAYNTQAGNRGNIWTDVGYVGLPFAVSQGQQLVLEAGVGYNDFVSDFLRPSTDNYTFARVKYATDATTLNVFYEKIREFEVTYSTTTSAAGVVTQTPVIDGGNNMNDNDVDQYGVNLIQKFNNDWSMNATVLYRDNQQALQLNPDGSTNDGSGFAANALFSGKANDVGLRAEIAYKQADYQSINYTSDKVSTTGDDGYGGYVAAKVPLGAASISAMVGATFNGFTASHDFGGDRNDNYAPFVMLSQPSTQVTGFLGTGILVGSTDGNAYFGNIAPSVKVSDQLTLTAEGTYMSAEYGYGKGGVNGGRFQGVNTRDIWEVGGIAQYKVSDGATITLLLGYLDIEDADNNPFGAGLALDLKF